MSLRSVRQSVADFLEEVKPEFSVYPVFPNSPVTLPGYIITPSNDEFIDYQESMGGEQVWKLFVIIMFPFTDIENSQDMLDDELSLSTSDGTVRRLMSDRTLGGRVNDSTVRVGERYGRADIGNESAVPIWGAVLKLEVREKC